MKLKQATKLAIIGIVLQLTILLMWFLVNLGVLKYADDKFNQFWYFKYSAIITITGMVFLLSFFITLYKSQK
jgi:hypothetical protein